MPTQQVVRIKKQGRSVVTYRDAKGRTKVGVVTAVSARPVNPPTIASATPATSGGTLADGTYYYRVSVVTTGAESIASAEVSAVVSGGAGAGQVTITVNAVAGATAYKFYGRAAGTEQQIASQAGVTFIDTGSVTPSGALPTLAKSTATVLTRYSNYSPKSGATNVPQAVAMRGAGTRYFVRHGSPAGYPVSPRA